MARDAYQLLENTLDLLAFVICEGAHPGDHIGLSEFCVSHWKHLLLRVPLLGSCLENLVKADKVRVVVEFRMLKARLGVISSLCIFFNLLLVDTCATSRVFFTAPGHSTLTAWWNRWIHAPIGEGHFSLVPLLLQTFPLTTSLNRCLRDTALLEHTRVDIAALEVLALLDKADKTECAFQKLLIFLVNEVNEARWQLLARFVGENIQGQNVAGWLIAAFLRVLLMLVWSGVGVMVRLDDSHFALSYQLLTKGFKVDLLAWSLSRCDPAWNQHFILGIWLKIRDGFFLPCPPC